MTTIDKRTKKRLVKWLRAFLKVLNFSPFARMLGNKGFGDN
jgi:hypothetical protein